MLIEPNPLSGHASPRVDYLHTAHPPPPFDTGRTVGNTLLNFASGVHLGASPLVPVLVLALVPSGRLAPWRQTGLIRWQ